MSTANLDAADLAAALSGGLINEDVIQQIYNLDEGIPTPFTDMVGGGSFSNPYSEWTRNDLNDVDLANKVVDGSDASGNNTKIGTRVGNRAQISDKVIQISDLAEEMSSVGNVGTMAYQTAKRILDLRRDVEAIALSGQASVADDGNATAGQTAGLDAWLTTNTDNGAGGTNGGFNTTTKIVAAYTPGAKRALSFADIITLGTQIYEGGGMPSVLMAIPALIVKLNAFLLSTDGAPYRAVPTANVNGGGGMVGQVAQGHFAKIVHPLGFTIDLVPNRLQQVYDSADSAAADVSTLFLIDPRYAAVANTGYRVDPLGKVGHSERKLAKVHWMLKVFREDAHAGIRDLDATLAVTA